MLDTQSKTYTKSEFNAAYAKFKLTVNIFAGGFVPVPADDEYPTVQDENNEPVAGDHESKGPEIT